MRAKKHKMVVEMTNSQEITTYSRDRAFKLMDLLTQSGYVCMLSKEEKLFVINFVPTYESGFIENEDYEASRSGVVFMSRYEFEEKYYENEREENE